MKLMFCFDIKSSCQISMFFCRLGSIFHFGPSPCRKDEAFFTSKNATHPFLNSSEMLSNTLLEKELKILRFTLSAMLEGSLVQILKRFTTRIISAGEVFNVGQKSFQFEE